MKTRFSLAALLVVPLAGVFLGAQTVEQPQVLESGPHHRVWETVRGATDESGQRILATNRWTELSTGLNWPDPATGSWEPSEQDFEITAQGYAVAAHGQHKVILAPNLNQPGSVDIELPDGQRLRSHPKALSYHSPVSGRTVLLAEIKDCPGELAEPNAVRFPSAFDAVPAALLYRLETGRHSVGEAPLAPALSLGLLLRALPVKILRSL